MDFLRTGFLNSACQSVCVEVDPDELPWQRGCSASILGGNPGESVFEKSRWRCSQQFLCSALENLCCLWIVRLARWILDCCHWLITSQWRCWFLYQNYFQQSFISPFPPCRDLKVCRCWWSQLESLNIFWTSGLSLKTQGISIKLALAETQH